MDKCPECGNKIKAQDKIIAEYFSCDKCGFEHIEYSNKCCLFPRYIPVRFYSDEFEAMQDSDNYRIYNQCQNCGKKIAPAISKSKYNKRDIPHSNDIAIEKVNLIKGELQELSKLIQERKRRGKRDSYWDDYNEYLRTERWRQIREIVLIRDNYKCQSCLNEKATQVHHTDGRFRKNEPLFTLFSVCDRCHDIITEIERGNHKLAQKVKYEFDK